MNDFGKIGKAVHELEKYASLSIDEYGEYLKGLLYLFPFSYFLPEAMKQMLFKEILKQLDYCKNRFNIVEKHITETYLELEDK